MTPLGQDYRGRSLTTRVLLLLLRNGVETWEYLAELTDDELLAMPMVGHGTLREIREVLAGPLGQIVVRTDPRVPPGMALVADAATIDRILASSLDAGAWPRFEIRDDEVVVLRVERTQR